MALSTIMKRAYFAFILIIGLFFLPYTAEVFAAGPWALNFTAGTGGTLTGSVSQSVPDTGDGTLVLATPDPGYHFVNWTGNGGFVTTDANPLAVRNVTADMNITANFAVNVAGTTVLPDYSKPVLVPSSQAATAWTNMIPNALASYYTYVPYSNADAVALGFPATCGNPAKGTPADLASTEDCYTITVQKVMQPMALPLVGFGGPGLIDPSTGLSFVGGTRGFAYGSGGVNWTPPGASVAVTGNAPAPFVDGTFGTQGIWHFPSPTIRGTKGRPIRVQWLNELPNEMPAGFDPTVDCGPNAPYCFPYNRIVTHVHGAHVTDDSDGYTEAWFTPGFALKGSGWTSSTHGPEGTFLYPMDQEAATVWYHDHAMGVTHNNTQMGMAGFFPITDANEQALIESDILPTGNYELGFALQDRVFDTNGQFAMPDYPVYDANAAGTTCTLTLDGLPDPFTCKRLDWMKAADGHLIPYVPGDPLLLNPNNAGAPFPAASTSLEYFGNMPMVNGVTYGKYDVEPRIYRMRFIGGSDSRTWILRLEDRANPGVAIPFWQVGSEQGLLPTPVSRTQMDLMPGERLDVLVDLTGVAVGHKLVLKNLGPDMPYGGPAAGDPPSVDIPEIMEFNVVSASGPETLTPLSLSTVLRPAIEPLQVTPGTALRNVSLVEITDMYGRTLPTIDARGFMDAPLTESVRINDVEEWAIINTTVDAHPMHLHLVQFQVISRQACDPTTFVAASTTPPYTQASCSGTGPVIPPDAWEAGWKDTIDVPPGTITRVRAKFDIVGNKYVYHCHILSHEEHDMMRPLAVVVGNLDLLFTAGANGSLSGTTSQNVAYGGDSTAVTAVPNAGYHFVNWTGPNGFVPKTLNPLTLTNVTASQAFIANFSNQYLVTAIAAGDGKGSVSSNPAGISFSYNAATTGGSLFTQGTTVVLTATASAGSTASWVNCVANGGTVGGTSTVATCTFTDLQTAITARAAFTENEVTVTANAAGNGAGTVNSNPVGISYSYNAVSTGSAMVNLGTTVVLTAAASAGSTVSWNNCVANGGTPGGSAAFATCTFTNMQASKSATATFTLNQYVLNALTGGNGSGSISGVASPYNHGSTATITANPGADSTFTAWSGCSTSTNVTIAVLMNSAKTCTANFTEYLVKMVNDGNPADLNYDNTINGAYAQYSPATSVSIFARDTLPMASVMMDQNISARLVGGFGLHFVDSPTSYTTIGTLTIGAGKLTIDRIIIR